MELSDMAKRMIKTILIIALVCIVGAIIYYRSLAFLPFLWGVILGTGASLFRVYLLDRAVKQALQMESNKAGNYAGLQHFLRLGVAAVALVLGAVITQINLWGVIAGIFAYQLAVYSLRISANRKETEN